MEEFFSEIEVFFCQEMGLRLYMLSLYQISDSKDRQKQIKYGLDDLKKVIRNFRL